MSYLRSQVAHRPSYDDSGYKRSLAFPEMEITFEKFTNDELKFDCLKGVYERLSKFRKFYEGKKNSGFKGTLVRKEVASCLHFIIKVILDLNLSLELEKAGKVMCENCELQFNDEDYKNKIAELELEIAGLGRKLNECRVNFDGVTKDFSCTLFNDINSSVMGLKESLRNLGSPISEDESSLAKGHLEKQDYIRELETVALDSRLEERRLVLGKLTSDITQSSEQNNSKLNQAVIEIGENSRAENVHSDADKVASTTSNTRTSQKPPCHILLIKPKEDSLSNDENKDKIYSAVGGTIKNIRIYRVRPIESGGLVIESQSKKWIDKLAKEMENSEELTNNYDLIRPIMSRQGVFSWWNQTLRKQRNFNTSLYKRVRSLKLKLNGTIEEIEMAKNKLRINRKIYKANIKQAKTGFWKQYCTNNS